MLKLKNIWNRVSKIAKFIFSDRSTLFYNGVGAGFGVGLVFFFIKNPAIWMYFVGALGGIATVWFAGWVFYRLIIALEDRGHTMKTKTVVSPKSTFRGMASISTIHSLEDVGIDIGIEDSVEIDNNQEMSE